MEIKGLEYSQYVSKESLAQQGGYALTNKGPQHDEAWLIFMDMVNKQIPTFEDKAEALHYFPLFRTWFGLQRPLQAALERHRAGRQRQDRPSRPRSPSTSTTTARSFSGVTGLEITKDEDHRAVGEGLQLPARLQPAAWATACASTTRRPTAPSGPVTVEEYESRAERYDKQMLEEIGVDPAGKSVEEKIAITRKYREDRYQQARATPSTSGAAGRRTACRRWRRSRSSGIDFPEVVELVQKNGG